MPNSGDMELQFILIPRMKKWEKELSNGSISSPQAIVLVCSKFVMTQNKYQSSWGLLFFVLFVARSQLADWLTMRALDRTFDNSMSTRVISGKFAISPEITSNFK